MRNEAETQTINKSNRIYSKHGLNPQATKINPSLFSFKKKSLCCSLHSLHVNNKLLTGCDLVKWTYESLWFPMNHHLSAAWSYFVSSDNCTNLGIALSHTLMSLLLVVCLLSSSLTCLCLFFMSNPDRQSCVSELSEHIHPWGFVSCHSCSASGCFIVPLFHKVGWLEVNLKWPRAEYADPLLPAPVFNSQCLFLSVLSLHQVQK